jgi:hypothetical protein
LIEAALAGDEFAVLIEDKPTAELSCRPAERSEGLGDAKATLGSSLHFKGHVQDEAAASLLQLDQG